MLLASFTSELTGTPRRQFRFAMPKNLEEAFKVAITVHQAVLQERLYQAFHVKKQGTESRQADRPNGSASRGDHRGQRPQKAAYNRPSRRVNEGSDTKTHFSENRKCFECGNVGHIARVAQAEGVAEAPEILPRETAQIPCRKEKLE
jgi:hypothetical protein